MTLLLPHCLQGREFESILIRCSGSAADRLLGVNLPVRKQFL